MHLLEEIGAGIQRLLGHRLVHRREDTWGEILVVDNHHRRVLSFGSAFEQTCIDLRTPHIPVHEYARAMLLGLAFAPPRRMLLLGLGGGALVHSLLHLVPADCTLHVIELREQVVAVARDYFQVPHAANLEITVEDARLALRNQPAASAELIFSDLYFASDMNHFQRQKKFLQQCHRTLTDDGWLVINFHRLPALDEEFFRWLTPLFPSLFICGTSSGNQILLAGKQPCDELQSLEPAVMALETQLGSRLMPCFRRLLRLSLHPEHVQ